MKTQSKNIIAGLLYTMAMTLIFIVLMFPYDELQARLLRTLSGLFPASLRAIGTYNLLPPFGIAWNDVRMEGTGRLSMTWRRVELSIIRRPIA